jgi:hypothetical protein
MLGFKRAFKFQAAWTLLKAKVQSMSEDFTKAVRPCFVEKKKVEKVARKKKRKGKNVEGT